MRRWLLLAALLAGFIGDPAAAQRVVPLLTASVNTDPSLNCLFTGGVTGASPAGTISVGPKCPIITATRASSATYFDATGTMQTAATNVARFDYDPATLAPRGLLVEEQRTNLFLNSASLGTQTVTVTATAYTLSFYGTGTIILTGTCSGTLIGAGAYPTRSTLTFTPLAGACIATVTGTATDGQMEAGAFATSYIPTTGSAATRAADVPSTPVGPWFNPMAGTLVVKARQSAPYHNQAGATAVALLTSITSVARISVRGDNAVSIFGTNSVLGTPLAGSIWTAAFAFSNAVQNGVLNGSSVVIATPVALGTGVINLGIGYNLGNQINGSVLYVKYYPRTLSAAELQSKTR